MIVKEYFSEVIRIKTKNIQGDRGIAMRKYTVQSESQAVLTDPNREREKVDAVCDSIVNNVPYSSKFVNNELALKKKKKKLSEENKSKRKN